MSKKRPSLEEALQTAERAREGGSSTTSAATTSISDAQKEELGPTTPEVPSNRSVGSPGTLPRQRSRQGAKNVTGYFAPAVSKQLKMMALENDSTVQELLREAINDLFAKHNKPPIA